MMGIFSISLTSLTLQLRYDKVRDTISIEHKNVDLMIGGLQKVDEWTLVAQENGVTRRVEKTSACIPDGACENKVQGVSSTEVVFQVYEDGSTAGRIQMNKGQFSTGYNMSVESSILLSAYLTYMRDVGSNRGLIHYLTNFHIHFITAKRFNLCHSIYILVSHGNKTIYFLFNTSFSKN